MALSRFLAYLFSGLRLCRRVYWLTGDIWARINGMIQMVSGGRNEGTTGCLDKPGEGGD